MTLMRLIRKHPVLSSVLSVFLILVTVFLLNVLVNGSETANRPGAESQKWLPNESVRNLGRFSR